MLHPQKILPALKLIIFHYHLRPGGIRRIIELATPHLVKRSAKEIQTVILATGENTTKDWQEDFRQSVAPASLEFFIEPTFNYLSEQIAPASSISKRIRSALKQLFADSDQRNTLVWTHNPGIARNLILTRELAEACGKKNIPCVFHHHDWWFDNRWLRWPEMRKFGFKTLESAATTIFPRVANLRHLTINQSDAKPLRKHLGKNRIGWLPNLTEPAPQPSRATLKFAREWIGKKLKDDAPVWILPCRLLRRKNVAEALLLARWLRPEGWLVTTGGVSSADEQAYATKLSDAAKQHGWRLRLGILAGKEARKPSVPALLAVSEAVMLTSIQEGFGLPYLEAAASRRPLIARAIPNIAPDLDQFGFRFPQCYEEIFVTPDLFDWKKEFSLQQKIFGEWKKRLPEVARNLAGTPAMLNSKLPVPVPFSRLTLSAQIEVLSTPPDKSWEKCAPINPFLHAWKERVANKNLRITAWPKTANNWLSGTAYARQFYELTKGAMKTSPTPEKAIAAQNDFIRTKMNSEHLFPLLWSKES